MFPNEAAVFRFVGAVLADAHNEWATDERGYLSEESMVKIGNNKQTRTVALTEA